MTGRASRRMMGAAAVATVLGVLALPSLAADDDLDLISRASGAAGAGANGDSSVARVSDGGVVAFISEADNLSDDDENARSNVFVRDTSTGTTSLVNRASGPSGVAANGSSLSASISADGSAVVFDSGATNLSGDDASGLSSIYLRRPATGETILVSRATGADGANADGSALQPSVSRDGRFVTFESNASNLSSDANGTLTQIFVRDTVADTTSLVSREGGAGGPQGDVDSVQSSVSSDGSRVAFASMATNLSDEDASGRDVFVRDRATDLTILVSRASGPAGAAADLGSSAPSISADGRFVAFDSPATNLSADDVDTLGDVFVRDLVTGSTILASRATGGAASADASGAPSISEDGRRVAFPSLGNNLAPDDDDGVRSVFVRDLVTGVTTLVSRSSGPAGAAATGADSSSTRISPDGRRVVFESGADNLSADDSNLVTNIFMRTLPVPAGPAPIALPLPVPAVGGGPPAASVVRCNGVRATIVGTARRDVIRGTGRRDVIASLGGDDRVRGLSGADLICLGAGNDTGDGGAGADTIVGGAGRDTLLGGLGADRLLGLAGRDVARGGLGRDVCAVEAKLTC